MPRSGSLAACVDGGALSLGRKADEIPHRMRPHPAPDLPLTAIVGYAELAREAGGISVSEIMAAVDEPVKMTRCAGESVIGCVATRRCTTHYLWDALGAHIEQFLAAATLADILHGRYAAPAMDFGLSELTAAAEVR